MSRIFLTAEWRHLAMINYAIDPAVLRPLVPAGTELDQFEGVTYASMVGFLFLKTRLLGVSIPFHQNFEEVNLRFYVRAKGPDGTWRRGVVFVRELVPLRAIAWVARTVYGEPYTALPMRHEIHSPAGGEHRARFAWKRAGQWESLRVTARSPSDEIEAGSLAEFITEHYWGYTTRRAGSSTQYEVEHPKWRIREASEAALVADVATLYGPQYVPALTARPASAFLAEGSPVAVRVHSPVL